MLSVLVQGIVALPALSSGLMGSQRGGVGTWERRFAARVPQSHILPAWTRRSTWSASGST